MEAFLKEPKYHTPKQRLVRFALVVSVLPLRVLHTDAETAEGTVFCIFTGISLLRTKNF